MRERLLLHRPYLLFLGTIQPRKNLARLLRAWQVVQPLFPELELLLAGGVSSHFREPGLGQIPAGVRLLGRIAEPDLPALYSQSLGVILPSLYEGFCLVGLEALACGAPVLAAHIPPFTAALGSAAHYFDPLSEQDIADKLVQFLRASPLRADLADRGREQAALFSLERSAESVWAVLNES